LGRGFESGLWHGGWVAFFWDWEIRFGERGKVRKVGDLWKVRKFRKRGGGFCDREGVVLPVIPKRKAGYAYT